ncbi:putative transcription factor TGA like domain-containing protein [Helianthus debilis subsp. tardiflorus]
MISPLESMLVNLGSMELQTQELVHLSWNTSSGLKYKIKKTTALKSALHSVLPELDILVKDTLNHYANLFNIKATAAKADVCYLISGVWKTSTEPLFLWIGGFRPSDLLKGIRCGAAKGSGKVVCRAATPPPTPLPRRFLCCSVTYCRSGT